MLSFHVGVNVLRNVFISDEHTHQAIGNMFMPHGSAKPYMKSSAVVFLNDVAQDTQCYRLADGVSEAKINGLFDE